MNLLIDDDQWVTLFRIASKLIIFIFDWTPVGLFPIFESSSSVLLNSQVPNKDAIALLAADFTFCIV